MFVITTFVVGKNCYLASIDDFSRQLRPDPHGDLDAVAALVAHRVDEDESMTQHFLVSIFRLTVC